MNLIIYLTLRYIYGEDDLSVLDSTMNTLLTSIGSTNGIRDEPPSSSDTLSELNIIVDDDKNISIKTRSHSDTQHANATEVEDNNRTPSQIANGQTETDTDSNMNAIASQENRSDGSVSCQLGMELLKLLEDDSTSDVTLRVGDTSFKLHK